MMGKQHYLDGEACFRKWYELGSLQKALNAMIREGIQNPLTGTPPTRMGIWSSAVKWMTTNPDKVRAILLSYGDNFATVDDEFWVWMLQRVSAGGHMEHAERLANSYGLSKDIIERAGLVVLE